MNVLVDHFPHYSGLLLMGLGQESDRKGEVVLKVRFSFFRGARGLASGVLQRAPALKEQ